MSLRFNLATNLQHLRSQTGQTQEAFGAHLGIHRSMVGALERAEKNVTLATIDKLAAALNVPPHELLAPPLVSLPADDRPATGITNSELVPERRRAQFVAPQGAYQATATRPRPSPRPKAGPSNGATSAPVCQLRARGGEPVATDRVINPGVGCSA